jgi:hypothetical protein
MIRRIVSGGQTGADRAALDWAIQHDVPHGGWCPKGRKAEDGPLDTRYQLTETETANYSERTRLNVADSDGTLIVNLGDLDGGTLKTLAFTEELGKPIFVVQIDLESEGLDLNLATQINEWIRLHSISKLNLAGPRESKRPGTFAAAWKILDALALIDAIKPVSKG